MKKKWYKYRSFRNFDVDLFNNDLSNKLNDIILGETDINNRYENFSDVFTELANKHAPVKKKRILTKPVPSMNKTLKQNIYYAY